MPSSSFKTLRRSKIWAKLQSGLNMLEGSLRIFKVWQEDSVRHLHQSCLNVDSVPGWMAFTRDSPAQSLWSTHPSQYVWPAGHSQCRMSSLHCDKPQNHVYRLTRLFIGGTRAPPNWVRNREVKLRAPAGLWEMPRWTWWSPKNMEDVPGVGGIYLQLECWVAVRYKVFLQDRFKINPWSMNRPVCQPHRTQRYKRQCGPSSQKWTYLKSPTSNVDQHPRFKGAQRTGVLHQGGNSHLYILH